MKKISASALLVAAAATVACSSDSLVTPRNAAPVVGPRFAGGITGAFNTSEATCTDTNVNKYQSKADVYLSGSPATANIPDGDYYVRVQTPNGADLGTTSTASYHVETGSTACIQLISLIDFGTTTNPGGEYRVLIDSDGDFQNAKNDNFKILNDETISVLSEISIVKFYDANGDGDQDAGENPIEGWKVNVAPFVDAAYDVNTTWVGQLAAGQYNFTEHMPIETNWVQTTAPVNPVTISSATTITFGNYCTYVGAGARTIGYYKNHNIASLLPVTLYSGVTVNTYTQVLSYLNGATSKDANVMLKAQLLAAVLNVKQDATLGTVYVPQFGKTVNAVIADARAFLAVNGSANLTKDSGLRTQALDLKTMLDKINNSTESNFGGLTLINATPCAFTFASDTF